ncbi:MAG: ABC transporter permease [Actinomycetota bacterium]|nr:ABC transporter permease [Actinomycetota bacterium]
MISALAIARASTRRVVRDRTAVFFLVVLPIVLMVIVGAVARGMTGFRVGVLDEDSSSPSAALVTALRTTPGLAVTSYASLDSLREAVARSDLDVGVVIPHGLGAAEHAARPADVELLAEQANSSQQAAAARVASVVGRVGGLVQSAQFATRFSGSLDGNLALATRLEPTTASVGVENEEVTADARTLPSGYEYSAPTELVLFVFLTALTGGATLVETRRLGVLERMSAAPVRSRTIVLGESLTYVAITLVQSVLLVAVGALAFGVSWGDRTGAAALVVVWCLVASGACMVAGTLFRTPEQAGAIGPVVGIVLAMLGGCMWPLSIVSPTMRAIGHVAPQAWAVDAWTTLLAGHGNVAAIAGDLAVLASYALVLFAVASARLRRSLLPSRA